MLFRYKTLCISLAVLPVAVAGIVFLQAEPVHAVPIGNPNPANFWDTTSAVTITDYSGERDTSGSPDGAGNRKVINIINGTGISGASGELHSAAGTFGNEGMFASLAGGAGDSGTFGMPGVFGTPNPGTLQGSGSHWIEFQFDQVYQLTDIAIWNDNQPTFYTQGWKHLAVQVSATGGTSPSDWTTVYNDLLPLSTGAGATDTPPALVIPVANISAQYVTLINTGLIANDEANWRTGTFDDHAALSEVRFNSGLLAPVAGDLDGDFDVDLTDYGVLTSNWLQAVPVNTLGDLNADSLVNIRDFGLFKEYYNDFNGIGGGGSLQAPVPEPATLVLLGLAMPAVYLLRKRRSHTN